MPLRGSFAGLRALRARVDAAGQPAFRAELGRILGVAGMKQLADEFKGSRDPYGKKWEPLRHRQGKPLLDTGRMAASVAVKPRVDGFDLVMTASYAPFHQYGVRNKPRRRDARGRFSRPEMRDRRGRILRRFLVPQRQMLPMDSTGGLGPIWERAFQRQSISYLRAFFARRRT